ncbi:MAG: alpha/beta hydrolase [Ruminococcus sp.]
MKFYSDELLALMNEKAYVSESFGSEILVKPIPDSEESGLDQRELTLSLEAMKTYKPCETVEDHRRVTGFAGLNLNLSAIITDKLTLESDGHSFDCWVYRTRKSLNKEGRPALLYIHGGSFFAGSAQYMENQCRFIAEKADCVVFNIEYSLAPELPFPSGLNDCIRTLDYVYENASEYGIDRNKICIAGDSAGAGLAASVALCDEKKRIRYMGLLYPCVLLDTEAPFEWNEADFDVPDAQRDLIIPRMRLGRTDGKGDSEFMFTIGTMYLRSQSELRFDPRVSPYYAALEGAPKATVFTAEYDGLRPQGEAFAEKLKSSGADVKCIRYRGVFHAFAEKTGYLPQAEDALTVISEDISSL